MSRFFAAAIAIAALIAGTQVVQTTGHVRLFYDAACNPTVERADGTTFAPVGSPTVGINEAINEAETSHRALLGFGCPQQMVITDDILVHSTFAQNIELHQFNINATGATAVNDNGVGNCGIINAKQKSCGPSW